MNGPFWHWPGWGRIGETLLLGLAFTAWWVLIYGGTNYVTGKHAFRVRVHSAIDLRMPFVPAAVLGYMSLYPLFWMAPFVQRTRQEIHALFGTLAAVTLVASICFVMLPVENAFPPPPADMGAWTEPVLLAKQIALTHNWLPSLHVALAVVCVAVYAGRAGWIGRKILWAWSLLIGVSTLLLNQHYLIDVVAGYALALAGVHWGYRRWRRPAWRDISNSAGSSVPAERPSSTRQSRSTDQLPLS
jgi:membrane-associated phospholipid phosphatase